MSIHPSLSATKGNKHRSVLKRFERVEKLKKSGKWSEETKAFGLPKVKIIKMKLKKTKEAKATTAEGAAAGEKTAADKTASK